MYRLLKICEEQNLVLFGPVFCSTNVNVILMKYWNLYFTLHPVGISSELLYNTRPLTTPLLYFVKDSGSIFVFVLF